MTELLTTAVRVRCDAAGRPQAVLRGGGGDDGAAPTAAVEAIVNHWRVQTDWWRAAPVCRDYWRCLLAGGECVELCCDRGSGAWEITRRYD